MPQPELNRRKIVARLEREGWTVVPGGKHDKYSKPSEPQVVIVVPRHHTLSPGVARSIAKLAGCKH